MTIVELILSAFVIAGALPLAAGCYQSALAALHRFRYADADPHATIAEIGRIVGGVADEIACICADDWARTVTRLPGEERTMRWLVRHAAHECRHHLADIARVGHGNHPRGDADKPS